MAYSQLSTIKAKPLRRSFIIAMLLHLCLLLMAVDFIYHHLNAGKQHSITIHSYVYPIKGNNLSGNNKQHAIPHPNQHYQQQQNKSLQSAKTLPSTSKTQASRFQASHGNSALLVALHNAIQQQQHYPAAALFNQATGSVLVSFTLLNNGQLQNIRVANSSGNSDLDQAAIKAVRAISPFKQYSIKKAQQLLVKVSFSLTN